MIIWLILLLPFIGFTLSFLLGKKRNDSVVWINIIIATLLLATSVFVFFNENLVNNQFSFKWLQVGNVTLELGFFVNPLTRLMLVLVSFIALLVQLFSSEYMKTDENRFRYVGFLNFFVFSMLGVVLADGLLMMYFFWELVGLSSYLLIGFWYQKQEAVVAAKKAFLMNRIGDVGFLIGIFIVYFVFQSTRFEFINSHLHLLHQQTGVISFVGLFLFCGCIGKSAQFPLHTWLPDAMEGPTPVSALIHAATMVAAGIFLLARIYPLFSGFDIAVIQGVGCFTMLMGAVYAIFQTDIKKTLAYSTVSQLGLMVMGAGADVSVFHLLTHAFFKAALFLCAGSVIHALHHAKTNNNEHYDYQDTRLMGGLKKFLPITTIVYILASLSLMGVPFFSGYLSKDALILNIFNQYNQQNNYYLLLFILVLLGVGLTAFYMTRQFFTIFMGEFRNKQLVKTSIHEANWAIKLPLIILVALSTGVFFAINPFSDNSVWLWDFLSGKESIHSNQHHLIVPVLSVFMTTLGIVSGYFLRNKNLYYTIPTFDVLFDALFVKTTLWLAKFAQIIDSNWIDALVNLLASMQIHFSVLVAWFDSTVIDGLVQMLAHVSGLLGKITRSFQGGKVQLYFVWALLGLLSLVFYVVSNS